MQARLRRLTPALLAVAVLTASGHVSAGPFSGAAYATDEPTLPSQRTLPSPLKTAFGGQIAPGTSDEAKFDRGRWCTYKKVEVYDEYHDETYTIDELVCLRGFLK